jgi:hypothetical protein
MAITIVSNPPSDSSINDAIWVTSSSTNTGTTNFKFVYDIRVNGNIVSTAKIFPNPNDTYGYYNVAPIVRNYITNYFEPSGTSILVESNDKCKVAYSIEVGEEVSGVVTSNMASGAFAGYNFYYPLFSDVYASGNLNVSDVYNTALTNYKQNWLTERDLNNISVRYGDKFFISYLKTLSGTFTGYVNTLNASGGVVSSYNATIPMSGEFNLFNLSATALNTWAGSTLITDTTYAYEFYIVRSGVESRRVKVTQYCNPKFNGTNLHFINRLGGWDTFNFQLLNRKSASVERKSFHQDDWQRSSGQMKTWDAYNRYNETKVTFNIRHSYREHLISDWITYMNYEWLYQLVASATIYIEQQSMYIPVSIADSNYTFKNQGIDKVFNLELDIEFSKNINSQIR